METPEKIELVLKERPEQIKHILPELKSIYNVSAHKPKARFYEGQDQIKLKKVREYPRQTYNELLEHLVSVFVSVKKRNQYDEFLHKIQQPKMKELWDNKEDEAWKNHY